MRLLRERLNDLIIRKIICQQFKSEKKLTSSYMYIQKIAFIIFDESRATKALDHSRLANLHFCNL